MSYGYQAEGFDSGFCSSLLFYLLESGWLAVLESLGTWDCVNVSRKALINCFLMVEPIKRKEAGPSSLYPH